MYPYQTEPTPYYFIWKPSLQFVDVLGLRLFCSLALFVLPGLVKGKTGKER